MKSWKILILAMYNIMGIGQLASNNPIETIIANQIALIMFAIVNITVINWWSNKKEKLIIEQWGIIENDKKPLIRYSRRVQALYA